jgi:hypothetical protein
LSQVTCSQGAFMKTLVCVAAFFTTSVAAGALAPAWGQTATPPPPATTIHHDDDVGADGVKRRGDGTIDDDQTGADRHGGRDPAAPDDHRGRGRDDNAADDRRSRDSSRDAREDRSGNSRAERSERSETERSEHGGHGGHG